MVTSWFIPQYAAVSKAYDDDDDDDDDDGI